MFKKLISGIIALMICGMAPSSLAAWEGTEVTGTVISDDYPGQFDWPDPVATISFTEVEFLREFTNVTTAADLTENMLVLTYENTSSFPNVTYPPLTYIFEFQEVGISDVSLVDSTFSSEIVISFTSDSITLEVPMQNTNPGEIFSAMFEIVHGTGSIEGALDIKPGSCPNSFNPRSQGVLPVALAGTDYFDVMNVDITSLTISCADGIGGSAVPNEGPPGPHSTFEDVATPFEGELCDCHEMEGDGITDLVMKFNTPEVVEALMLYSFAHGDLVELVVSGTLLDGTEFSASDCIRIVGKKNTLLGGSLIRR